MRGRRSPFGALLGLSMLRRVLNLRHKPAVTLALMAACYALFYFPHELHAPPLRAACLVPRAVLAGDWRRAALSPLYHADDLHLHFNMGSLLVKGALLEPALGPERFLAVVAALLAVSQALFVALADSYVPSQMNVCAVGFSGVLFGLKVLANSSGLLGDRVEFMFLPAIPVPRRFAVWVELLLVQLMMPHVSFWGHLCGIVAGLVVLGAMNPDGLRAAVGLPPMVVHPRGARLARSRGVGRSAAGPVGGPVGGSAAGPAAGPAAGSAAGPAAGAAAAPAIDGDELRRRRLAKLEQADARRSGRRAKPVFTRADFVT